jgi:hypothetical protein
MKWVRDATGRFPQRPYWLTDEIESEAERVLDDFRTSTGRASKFPLSTDDLTVLIESRASDFDLYADLSADGDDVEGVTEFSLDGCSTVRIDRRLASDARRENRLRTTLTHEYAHLHLHGFLAGIAQTVGMFDQRDRESVVCRRETIADAPAVDWMEWQAAHMSGALLMPRGAVTATVQSARGSAALSVVDLGSAEGDELVASVSLAYDVSWEAARVRLQKLRLVGDAVQGQTAAFR